MTSIMFMLQFLFCSASTIR